MHVCVFDSVCVCERELVCMRVRGWVCVCVCVCVHACMRVCSSSRRCYYQGVCWKSASNSIEGLSLWPVAEIVWLVPINCDGYLIDLTPVWNMSSITTWHHCNLGSLILRLKDVNEIISKQCSSLHNLTSFFMGVKKRNHQNTTSCTAFTYQLLVCVDFLHRLNVTNSTHTMIHTVQLMQMYLTTIWNATNSTHI